MISELAIVEGIAAGVLPSPQAWQNSTYVKIRLSGTGVAYRPSIGEYVYRSPDIWLSPAMARRCLGLPIVIEHPPSSLLTSRYFGDRIVGMVVHSFVDEDEQALWGIGRVLDDNAASMIEAGLFCTSPAVSLPPWPIGLRRYRRREMPCREHSQLHRPPSARLHGHRQQGRVAETRRAGRSG